MKVKNPVFESSEKTLRARAPYLALLCVAATAALPHQINLVFIGLLLVAVVLSHLIPRAMVLIRDDRLIQFILLFFLLNVIAAIRDESVRSFFSTTERKSVLFILPMLLGTVTLCVEQFNAVLRCYIISILISIILSFILLHTSDVVIQPYDYTHYFWQLAEHATIPSNYLSLYASFGIIILVHKFETSDLFSKPATALIALLLFTFISAVGARMAFFTTIAIIILRIPYLWLQYGTKPQLKTVLAIVLVGILAVAFMPYFKNKLFALTETRDPRYYEFKAAVNVLKINPAFGLGFYEADKKMIDEYSRMGFQAGIDNVFNAHNEYLQIGITMGFTGIIVLLAIIYTSLRRSLWLKDFLCVSFFLLFIMASMTESLLTRNKGIVFFAFFTGLFLFSKRGLSNET